MQARVLFAGTPAFALASLEALLAAGVVPVAIFTQPDRPSGRGQKPGSSPVKAHARGLGLSVYQPATLRDEAWQAELAALEPDLIIVSAYGLILPPAVLELPRLGCLNVHASLLPRWRGAAPIQAAIAAGDRETGVSLMRMEAGLDSGPVYARASVAIGDDETAGELHDRLAVLGGELLVHELPDILAGRLQPVPQDSSLATWAGKLGTADAMLDWRRPAVELARQIRAYNPVPGARFRFAGEQIKCWRAEVCAAGAAPAAAGTVVAADRNGVEVACGEGTLCLLALQRPGRKRVTGGEFAGQFALAGRQLPSAPD